MKPEATRIDGHGGRARERLRVDAPQEEADVRDVVAPARAGDAPHVDRAWDRIERRADAFQRLARAQIGRRVVEQALVVHVLRRDQHLEELDRARVPAGDVAGQLLQHHGGALAAPERDRVRHLGARAADPRRDAVEHLVADEVADVRHHPGGARLDELIVVQLIEILLQHTHLLGQHGQQARERPRQRRLLQRRVLRLLRGQQRQAGVDLGLQRRQRGTLGRRQPPRRDHRLRQIAKALRYRQQLEQLARVEAGTDTVVDDAHDATSRL